MMKKAFFLAILLPVAISSFSQNIPNKFLYIDGSASKMGHYEFFFTNFMKEAAGAGYVITDSKDAAAHTLKFVVTPSVVPYDDRITRPPIAEPAANEFLIKISLISNKDDFEIVTFDFFFTDLDEMYNHTRAIFKDATLLIPVTRTVETEYLASEHDRSWQNKTIYIRASFDYPITFYQLKGTGLIGGAGLYEGDYDNPGRPAPIDNIVTAMPGFTIGVEYQFLNFMSAEVNYQFSMGDTRKNTFINMSFGTEIKFPIKFNYLMLAPYLAFFYPITVSDVFQYFPPFFAGAGVQLFARGGKFGAFFVDVKYMISFKDTIMHNPYLVLHPDKRLYPEPPVIHYRRSFIGIGIGYKIGFLDRKPKK